MGHQSEADLSTSFTFAKLLKAAFPSQYTDRLEDQKNILMEAKNMRKQPRILPIFMLDPILPKQRLRLMVYEPRYKLMVQRCLQGRRRFGMIGRKNAHNIFSYGTEVSIEEYTTLDD